MTDEQPQSKGAPLVNLVVMMAVVALVLIGVAVAVANADAGMPDVQRDLPDTGLPTDGPMTPADVDAVRFSMAPRGYRMREVDEALGRLRDELAARDAEIERLRTAEVGDTVEYDYDEYDETDEDLDLDPGESITTPLATEPHA